VPLVLFVALDKEEPCRFTAIPKGVRLAALVKLLTSGAEHQLVRFVVYQPWSAGAPGIQEAEKIMEHMYQQSENNVCML
jgi:hypothetical protein